MKQIATSASTAPTTPAVSALTNLALQEKGNTSNPAKEALASVLQGKEKSLVKIKISENIMCNGFVVDPHWIATAAYCLSNEFSHDAKQVTVEFWDGTATSSKEIKSSLTSPVSLIKIDPALQPIELSSKVFHVGDSVTQMAINLVGDAKTPAGQLQVVFGRIVKIGNVSFSVANGSPITDTAFSVTLPSRGGGTGGAPLLDAEGNVACMTYQGDNQTEQCVPVDAIRKSLNL